jgi:hypothetical protein
LENVISLCAGFTGVDVVFAGNPLYAIVEGVPDDNTYPDTILTLAADDPRIPSFII